MSSRTRASSAGLIPHAPTHEPTGTDEVHDIDILNTGVLLSAHRNRHKAAAVDELARCATFIVGLGAQFDYNTADYASPDAAVQAALNALPGGRTWPAVVVVIGNFIMQNTVNVPSWTILIVYGRWTLANARNIPLLQNSDLVAGNIQVTILCGIFDGNKANQAANFSVIRLVRCTDSLVQDVEAVNAFQNLGVEPADPGWEGAGILLLGCTNSDVIHCRARTNGYVGIGMGRINIAAVDYDPTDCSIEDCYTTGNGTGMGAGSNGSGIRMGYALRCLVGWNKSIQDAHFGINMRNNCYQCVVEGNRIFGNNITQGGINLTNSPQMCNVFGNTIRDCTEEGIRTNGALYCQIALNTINRGRLYGIYIYSGSHYNTVMSNYIDNESLGGSYAIYVTSSNQNIIAHNWLRRSAQYNIFIDNDSNDNDIWGNLTRTGGVGECRVNNANCDTNKILGNDFAGVAVSDIGTGTVLTRVAWDNY